MANKEFKVPPVSFPAGIPAPNLPQRRVPNPPFQPNSSIPFMSFDIGSAAASTSSGPIYTGHIGSGGSANFEDEEPLLDELGIHPDQIWSKIRSVLNPFRVNHTIHKDSDLSGPILLYMSFCLFQLLAGKIQFGVILGWIGGVVAVAIAAVFVLWSTRASTGLIVSLTDGGDEHRGLVAYACFLIYSLFSLLVVF
ncbi:hypothetical protein Lalb_Chr25g0288381 [Lupinus albus]|uniref:Uncharacterized protein n=1 Tax=Lupinus albus TaxID=3870 RepID=A0A6A4ND53_LUPAL|nr:hypothetical protein Lalb_Chr25g0288381 [Lupinus albus]